MEAIKQTDKGLSRGLSSNLSWLRNANHKKFAEEYVMYWENKSEKYLQTS